MDLFTNITTFLNENTGSEILTYGLVVLFIAIWVYVWLWVLKDIINRTDNVWLQFLSVLLVVVLTWVIWLPLYFLIRPINYKHERHIWFEWLDLQTIVCSHCYRTNLTEYENCVLCGHKLKITCKNCGGKYPFNYMYCYTCGAPNIEI